MTEQRWKKEERPEQADLFGDPEGLLKPDWEKEWQDMPEFKQDQLKCHAMIIVRFSNEKDMKEFGELIGQKINSKTQSIWHPKLNYRSWSNQRYADES